MRAETIAARKAEAGYTAPHEQEICARCEHHRLRGGMRETPTSYCIRLHFNVAQRAKCDLFAWRTSGPRPNNPPADEATQH